LQTELQRRVKKCIWISVKLTKLAVMQSIGVHTFKCFTTKKNKMDMGKNGQKEFE